MKEKNCSSDLRVGCKPPSNKVELIQTNLDFEEELKKIESSFEQDEIMNIQNDEKKFKNFFLVQFFYFKKLKVKIKNNTIITINM